MTAGMSSDPVPEVPDFDRARQPSAYCRLGVLIDKPNKLTVAFGRAHGR
jgi:hypothetical protein